MFFLFRQGEDAEDLAADRQRNAHHARAPFVDGLKEQRFLPLDDLPVEAQEHREVCSSTDPEDRPG